MKNEPENPMPDALPPFVIGYLAHDVYDKGVERRAEIFHAGGSEVVTVGFRRQDPPRALIAGKRPHDLGRTKDAALLSRALASLRQALCAPLWAAPLRTADVVVAKTLEMLVVAFAARYLGGVKAPIVYECCDIHRTLISPGISGRLMRALERALLHRCALLITTSPAFAREHFRRIQGSDIEVLLLENKTFLPDGAPEGEGALKRPPSRPWTIGWFGIIRCRKSLDFLIELTQRLPGLVQVVIAGRVAETEIPDFAQRLADAPGIEFIGPYEMSQLGDLYGRVHFAWAIDYFEQGGNSEWLLPNRIYEGGAYDAISIALAEVETGRWLAARQLGVLVSAPVDDLDRLFRNLTDEAYHAMAKAAAGAPRSYFLTNQAEAMHIVQEIRGLVTTAPGPT